ncbi:hypothetical protein DS62_10500 [Smithella sp. SC_K08D17]|nr:hypothetical protein KD27_09105 [Smithella sp. D17]KIE18457.1 hypothetical protein DS62_10500 [Smithella sp. SC_K08D17]
MQDTEPIKALSTELNRISEIAARDSKVKFTSLADQWDDNTKNWEKRAWYNPPGGCLSENSQQPQANII